MDRGRQIRKLVFIFRFCYLYLHIPTTINKSPTQIYIMQLIAINGKKKSNRNAKSEKSPASLCNV